MTKSARAFGGRPPDGVVGIAPDVERRHADRAERRTDRAARAIPGQRRLHRRPCCRARPDARAIAAAGTPAAASRSRRLCVVGQHQIGGIGFEKRLVMPRALRLIAVGHLQRAVEGVGMRPRQHGERGQPLRIAIGQRPGDAAAPVVADEMKAAVAVAAGRDDRHRIVHQPVDVIIRGVAGVRPRARRIAALARRHRAIARGRQAPPPARASNASIRQSRAAAAPAARRAAPATRASKVRPGAMVIFISSGMEAVSDRSLVASDGEQMKAFN